VLVAVLLSAAAGALALPGVASAIDLPEHLRKPPAKAAPKFVAPKNVAPKNFAPKFTAPNGVAPNGAARNAVTPNGVSPTGVAPNGTPPNGANPKGIATRNLTPGAATTNTPNAAAATNNAASGNPALRSTGTAKSGVVNNAAAGNTTGALNNRGPAAANPNLLSKGKGPLPGALPGTNRAAALPGPGVGRAAALAAPGPRRDALRAFNARTPADFRRFEATHRQALFAQRALLPVRPLPFERGFSGVPPVDERRFVSNEMVFQAGAGIPQDRVDAAARRLGLTVAGSYTSALTGGTIYRFRISDSRQMAEVVRAFEAENIGAASPNYVFRLTQDATSQPSQGPSQDSSPAPANDQAKDQATDANADPGSDLAASDTELAARSKAPDPSQYVVDKLRLGDVHRVATGSNVLVAVIDSEIDAKHPDLAGAIVERYDAARRADPPHSHGTGMTGAIAAHRKLMGIAPEARILAIHAFSPDAKESPQATTQHILDGMEYAIKKGARIINMSFAGPYDPMLALAMKKAREKGIVLIAAAGNAGPKSPPLYPAADPNVIAVTATDSSDQLFEGANRGPQVALAAPGVDILAPAPNSAYQLTTGTSVAAAHVSGVAALLIQHNPSVDVDTVQEILTASARTLGPNGRDDQFGWGLVDPAQALADLDARMTRDRVASAPAAAPAATPVAAPAPTPAAARGSTPAALTPAAARLPVGRAAPVPTR
jgi:subtilisin family serine protease